MTGRLHPEAHQEVADRKNGNETMRYIHPVTEKRFGGSGRK